jgi:ABC-type uncharacterized transport system ATPase subunit
MRKLRNLVEKVKHLGEGEVLRDGEMEEILK